MTYDDEPAAPSGDGGLVRVRPGTRLRFVGDVDRDGVGVPPVQITELRLRHYRDAKGELRRLRGAYRETVDQVKLSATLDLGLARGCRWFRKFEKELLAILSG